MRAHYIAVSESTQLYQGISLSVRTNCSFSSVRNNSQIFSTYILASICLPSQLKSGSCFSTNLLSLLLESRIIIWFKSLYLCLAYVGLISCSQICKIYSFYCQTVLNSYVFLSKLYQRQITSSCSYFLFTKQHKFHNPRTRFNYAIKPLCFFSCLTTSLGSMKPT